jgi:hypothetical protein
MIMRTDKNGCSTCPEGCEQYEFFKYGSGGAYQYEFRDYDGKLFTTVRPTLKECRIEKDIWLQNKAKNIGKS